VTLALNQAGIRQARPWRTTTGLPGQRVGLHGAEFLPGRACPDPAPAQSAVVMRHVVTYHLALAEVPVPAGLREETTLWKRVASVDYLVAELPWLVAAGLPEDVQAWSRRRWRTSRPLLRACASSRPSSSTVTSGRTTCSWQATRWSPSWTSPRSTSQPLFAIATAMYWYHVYGRDGLDLGAVAASLDAAGKADRGQPLRWRSGPRCWSGRHCAASPRRSR
jgi:hypothetical protein